MECDTCKMSYCLVCLASGTKDPCVRCGHRTSKRVEQLVHLRLKSIYKAFKQSGAALDNNSKGASRKKSDAGHSSGKHSSSNNDTEEGVSVSVELGNGSHHHSDVHDNHNFQSGDDKKKGGNKQSCPPLSGDVGAVLQVAAAAAASAAASAKGSGCKDSSQNMKRWSEGMGVHPGKVLPHLNHDGSISFRSRKEPKKNASDLHASKTEDEANAAAAALLAELEEEKEHNEASTKAKKSKKKKKKERQAAKEREKEERARLEQQEKAAKLAAEAQKQKQSKQKSKKVSMPASIEETVDDGAKNSNEKKSKKKTGKAIKAKPSPPPAEEPNNDESDDDDIVRLAEATGIDVKVKASKTVENKEEPPDDHVEIRLASMVSANDLDGIESIFSELKGVPGRAALRKNAKKALKRIREEIAEASKSQNDTKSGTVQSNASTDVFNGQAQGYKATEPLLKLVSNTHRVQPSSGGTPRSECVMHMAPSVVGWVIGKGGQRIRDLMEDSGAKVWIDQDSMGQYDMRIVYVSGTKKAIDTAVRTIKDLVAKAPVGGTTQPGGTVPSVVNDAASVTSARSDLTSTPVSMVQNFTTQAPAAAKKPDVIPPRRHVEPIAEVQSSVISPVPKSSGHASPSHSVSLPPPGLEAMSNSPTVSSLTVSNQSNDDIRSVTPKAVQELFCEPRFVPLLIGRRGWTVKNIQDTSGARVDIDQKVVPRRIIISGDEEQVNKAVRLVSEVLSYPHAQSNYNTTEAVDGDINEVLNFQNAQSNLNTTEVVDGNIGVGSLAGLVPHATQFSTGPQKETGQMPMQLVRASSTVPPLSQYPKTPLDFGAIPNRSFNEPSMRQPLEHSSTFGYGQQIHQQILSGQMNSPQQPMRSSASSSVNVSPAYMARQNSAPIPVRPNGSQMNPEPFDRNFLRDNLHQDRQPASGNFQYDTILPLNHGRPASQQHFANVSQESNIASNIFSRQQAHPKNDHDVVNNLFGQPVQAPSYPAATTGSRGGRTDSLLQSFGNLSFGTGGDNELGLEGANWDWEGLMNDESSSNHRVGLGGVRLDTSSEMPTNRNAENQFQSNWGM